jgi:hypothetical protein
MFTLQLGRLLRKVLFLAVLLAGLAVMSNESAVRKVEAQTTCCQNCQNVLTDCMNNCQTPYCPQTVCFPRYNYCRSQCSPACS